MNESYMGSIEIITNLLKEIENLEEGKKGLLATLVQKEKEWIDS